MAGGPYLALCEAAKKHNLALELRVGNPRNYSRNGQLVRACPLSTLALTEPDGTPRYTQAVRFGDLDAASTRLLHDLMPKQPSS